MKKMPLIKNNRFYNHENDSVYCRVKSIKDTLFHIVKNKFSRATLKPFFTNSKQQNQWVSKPNFRPASQTPLITWFGQATFLIQLGGINILTDPVFGEMSRFAPRMMPFPIDPSKLPPIQIILLSHNHGDHFCLNSLKQFVSQQPKILCPLKDSRLLKPLGFTKIIEKNWWEHEKINDVNLTFLPASHWSGRGPFDINKSLWGSWMIDFEGFQVYFAGDTADGDHFTHIGEQFQTIEVALLPVGPTEPAHMMEISHVNTQQAVQAFLALQAQQLVPMHWGTFKAGIDTFDDPINKLNVLWQDKAEDLKRKELKILKFGEQVAYGL
jgi:L-ascorbate metabolism protein UlaG (beta-lactamase superfamily)